MQEAVAPQNLEAEESILGACIISPGAIPVAVDVLVPDDFYREIHRHIFSAIQELYVEGDQIDLVTLGARLRQQRLLEDVGGKDYLHTLTSLVPSVSNAKHYADLVKGAALLRSLVTAGHLIADLGYAAEGKPSELMEQAETILFGVRATRTEEEGVEIQTLIADFAKRIEDARAGKQTQGHSSTFATIDNIIGGFEPGTLSLLAARPSVGKTALALNMAAKMAASRYVAFFSMEMSKRELMERMACGAAGVGITAMRAGAINDLQEQRLFNALQQLEKLNLHIDDTANLSMLNLRSKVRRLAARRELGIVFVDYMQLMNMGTGRHESRNYEMAAISRSMKHLAREFRVPVVSLSQLSRPPKEVTSAPQPRLSDLRDSGALEQDADMVMFLHREEKKDEPVDTSQIKFIVAKHRTGAIGEVWLRFDPSITKFSDRY